MAQPSTQELIDTGNSLAGNFYYAQGTGLWDATNGAMLTKTGSAGMSAEGGANVVVGNSSTYYSLPSVLTLSGAYTIGFKCRLTTSGDSNSIICGRTDGSGNFVWVQNGSTNINIRATGDSTAAFSGADSMHTIHITKASGSVAAKLYIDGSYSADFGTAQSSGPDIGAILGGYSGGSLSFTGVMEFMHILAGHECSSGEVSSLASDPYQILDIAATSEFTFSTTTASATFSGSATVPAVFSFAKTTAAATFSGSAETISDPYIVTEPLKNNTGTVLASQSGITAYIYDVSDGSLVLTKTGQTTDASGVMTISDATWADATEYRVVVVMSGGAEGMGRYTTQ